MSPSPTVLKRSWAHSTRVKGADVLSRGVLPALVTLVFLHTLIRMFLHLPKKMLEWRQNREIIGTGLDVIAYL